MESPLLRLGPRPASHRGARASRSPGRSRENSARREEARSGADGILLSFGKRIDWLDVQISALATEVLKSVKTVGLVQELARSTEARVKALEERQGSGTGGMSPGRATSHSERMDEHGFMAGD